MHDQALLLEMLIYQLGQDLVGAASFGQEVLSKIAEVRPDIIWLDNPLKYTPDGFSIAQQIRKIYNPVIIGLTPGSRERRSRRRLSSSRTGSLQREPSGFTHCFSKPISFSKVKASVQGAV
ncbi:hypothetical protein DDZ15_15485 [Rhodohalobacter mucosus]|uniref:Response regulatory domain-containing protein n=2 Tax=Rhodohalobacter mucosus TaxID=2079485 RepID=A0A316TR11_9BACT|nr:hypothetical protein DDZ15_15485 [Rhodohalobacter mucosus]